MVHKLVPLLLVSQYLRSRQLNTIPRLIHLWCLHHAKTSYLLVLWLQAPLQKAEMVGALLILAQADKKVLSLDHQKGEMNLRHFLKSGHII